MMCAEVRSIVQGLFVRWMRRSGTSTTPTRCTHWPPLCRGQFRAMLLYRQGKYAEALTDDQVSLSYNARNPAALRIASLPVPNAPGFVRPARYLNLVPKDPVAPG